MSRLKRFHTKLRMYRSVGLDWGYALRIAWRASRRA